MCPCLDCGPFVESFTQKAFGEVSRGLKDPVFCGWLQYMWASCVPVGGDELGFLFLIGWIIF